MNVLASEPERRLPRESQSGSCVWLLPKYTLERGGDHLIKCNKSAIISQSDYLLVRENGLKYGKAILWELTLLCEKASKGQNVTVKQ